MSVGLVACGSISATRVPTPRQSSPDRTDNGFPPPMRVAVSVPTETLLESGARDEAFSNQARRSIEEEPT